MGYLILANQNTKIFRATEGYSGVLGIHDPLPAENSLLVEALAIYFHSFIVTATCKLVGVRTLKVSKTNESCPVLRQCPRGSLRGGVQEEVHVRSYHPVFSVEGFFESEEYIPVRCLKMSNEVPEK